MAGGFGVFSIVESLVLVSNNLTFRSFPKLLIMLISRGSSSVEVRSIVVMIAWDFLECARSSVDLAV